jgi:HK97 gp10 family phage protein
MTIVRNAARANAKRVDAKDSKERIWKNIVMQESGKAGKRIGGVVMKVGVRGGASFNSNSNSRDALSGGDTRHWRFIELGTVNNPAQPFMRPALRDNIQQVTQVFMTELNSEIAAAMAGA